MFGNAKRKSTHKFLVVCHFAPSGQEIPPGLHVEIDMQSGVKRAKLMDEKIGKTHLFIVYLRVCPNVQFLAKDSKLRPKNERPKWRLLRKLFRK